jgi:hypothetical protein
MADDRGDRVLKIALVEIIEGSSLAPLHIFVARDISDERTAHSNHPKSIQTDGRCLIVMRPDWFRQERRGHTSI